jgi:ElaB/YqjD/DUF883 family membrane-anchored ribosome-binding protein
MNETAYSRAPVALVLILGALLSGCQGMKYRTLETFGVEKRDILSGRVESARDAQDEAKAEFASALEQFRATIEFDGGELEDAYDRLDKAHQRSRREAERVHERIEAVRTVAEDLFAEWSGELDAYESADLRRQSRELLDQTRTRYERMMSAMERAQTAMAPVLQSFEDQVLFLKHNLNARAISALERELDAIETETETLISAMNEAIAEADAFIENLE